jgi:hypothetical protein
LDADIEKFSPWDVGDLAQRRGDLDGVVAYALGEGVKLLRISMLLMWIS